MLTNPKLVIYAFPFFWSNLMRPHIKGYGRNQKICIFVGFFGSNENKKICFQNYLTFKISYFFIGIFHIFMGKINTKLNFSVHHSIHPKKKNIDASFNVYFFGYK